MITGLQAVYKQQVTKTIEGLEKALDEAKMLQAKSHDNSWEQKETTKMVEDVGRWLRCWKEYKEIIRQDPGRMFSS